MKPTLLRSFIALAVLTGCLMGVTGCFYGHDDPHHDDRGFVDHHDDDHHDWDHH